LTFKTHAIAVTALLLAAGASHAAAEERDHDAIKLTRPHHHHEATTAATEVKTDGPAHERDHPSDAHNAPDLTAHDMGPHHNVGASGKETNEPANTKTLTVHGADHGRGSVEPPSEALMPPREKSIFFHPSAIDKKMMGAIGLLRPKKSFTAAIVRKPGPPTLPSNVSNVFGSHGKETLAAFGGIGRPVGAHNFALAPAGAVTAFATRTPNPAAAHDAILNGTGFKRPVSVIASIGGAPIRKPTFTISGSDVHLKMR
jgi:hypothetical protein